MYNVITKLDSLVDSLYQLKNGTIKIDKEESEHWMEFAANNHTQLKQYLLQDALSNGKENSFKFYISNVQTALITLLDKVHSLELELKKSTAISEEQDCNLNSLIFQLREGLERTLIFTEQYFTQFFDHKQKLPCYKQEILRNELFKKIEIIRENSWVNTIELFDIALNPIEKFIHNNISISYTQLQYYNDLIIQIAACLEKPTCAIVNELNKNLLQLNFNDAAFFEYSTRIIKAEIDQLLEDKIKVKELNRHLKYIKQLHSKANACLYNELPSIQQQLIVWLQEEIAYIKADENLHSSIAPEADKNDESKIHLSISVSVLGFLLKLLVASRIVANTNQSDIIRFFARHFKTTKQEEISFDSLYNKYHQANTGTTKITKELLVMLMNLIPKLS